MRVEQEGEPRQSSEARMVSAQSSRASSSGGRYRTVSKGSEVDESLFGSTKPGARAAMRGSTKKKVQIESFAPPPTFPVESMESVTISGSDLMRIRGSSNILSPEQSKICFDQLCIKHLQW